MEELNSLWWDAIVLMIDILVEYYGITDEGELISYMWAMGVFDC